MENGAIQFFKEGIRHINETGTFMPCSKTVGKKIASKINNKNSSVIVELGAGTGAITKEILKKIEKNQKLLCFEINKKFCKTLEKINDPRIKVINDYAESFPKYIKKKPSYVVSTLPLALFPVKQKNMMLKVIKENLANEGKFIQFQYSLNAYKKIKSYFKDVKINFILFNLLPGFVYTCSNE